MFEEEPVRIKRPDTLDQMSVSDLVEKIAALQAEIAAYEAEIARKRAQKAAADALFGDKG
jgi:uncharacterized small protein (DUF1192 family)